MINSVADTGRLVVGLKSINRSLNWNRCALVTYLFAESSPVQAVNHHFAHQDQKQEHHVRCIGSEVLKVDSLWFVKFPG